MNIHGLQLVGIINLRVHNPIHVPVLGAAVKVPLGRDQRWVEPAVLTPCCLAPPQVEPLVVDLLGGLPLQQNRTGLPLGRETHQFHKRGIIRLLHLGR